MTLFSFYLNELFSHFSNMHKNISVSTFLTKLPSSFFVGRIAPSCVFDFRPSCWRGERIKFDGAHEREVNKHFIKVREDDNTPSLFIASLLKVRHNLWQSLHRQTERWVQRTRPRRVKQPNVKWAKILETSNEMTLHVYVLKSQQALNKLPLTSQRIERPGRYRGLCSRLITFILPLQFIRNTANGFTESGLRDEFRLTFQYESNLRYLFSCSIAIFLSIK